MVIFAFDFIVEKLSELQPKQRRRINAISFKLLDFQTVFVVLSHQDTLQGRPVYRVNKGKSVVFEMDPKYFLQGLSQRPLKVNVTASSNEVQDQDLVKQPPPIADTSGCIGRCEVDLKEMAVSMEALMTSQKQQESESQENSCRVCSRERLDVLDSFNCKIATLNLKLKMGWVLDDVPLCQVQNQPRNGFSENMHKTPSGVDEANKPECTHTEELCPEPVNSSGRRKGLDADSHTDAEYTHNPNATKTLMNTDDHTDATESCGAGKSTDIKQDTENCANVSETLGSDNCSNVGQTLDPDNDHTACPDSTYFPNLVCPPPLVYHSGGSPHLHAQSQQPTHSQNSTFSDPLYAAEGWGNSIVPAESHRHWSLLAKYDQSSFPITTQLRDFPDSKLHDARTENLGQPRCVKNLPLLSALLEELSYLGSSVQPLNVAKKSPEKVSVFSQTESLPKQEKKLEVRKKIAFNHNNIAGARGRFVRKCCLSTKPKAMPIPKSKSFLYPPDIRHKRRKSVHGTFVKELPAQQNSSRQEKTAERARGIRTLVKGVSASVDEDQTRNESSPFRRLDVVVPCASQSSHSTPPATPSPCKEPTPSSTAIPRESLGVSVETQTDAAASEDRGAQKPETTEHSVQTEVVVGAGLEAGSEIESSAKTSESAFALLNEEPQNGSFSGSPREERSPSSAFSIQEQRERELASAHQSLHLSRRKFSSTGDISTLPESPLLRSIKNSSISKHLDTLPRNESARNLSQMFDSLMSDDMAASGGRVMLPKNIREGIYLATSQSSLASEGKQYEIRGKQEVVKEEEEEEEEEEESDECSEYTDTFEDSTIQSSCSTD